MCASDGASCSSDSSSADTRSGTSATSSGTEPVCAASASSAERERMAATEPHAAAGAPVRDAGPGKQVLAVGVVQVVQPVDGHHVPQTGIGPPGLRGGSRPASTTTWSAGQGRNELVRIQPSIGPSCSYPSMSSTVPAINAPVRPSGDGSTSRAVEQDHRSPRRARPGPHLQQQHRLADAARSVHQQDPPRGTPGQRRVEVRQLRTPAGEAVLPGAVDEVAEAHTRHSLSSARGAGRTSRLYDPIRRRIRHNRTSTATAATAGRSRLSTGAPAVPSRSIASGVGRCRSVRDALGAVDGSGTAAAAGPSAAATGLGRGPRCRLVGGQGAFEAIGERSEQLVAHVHHHAPAELRGPAGDGQLGVDAYPSLLTLVVQHGLDGRRGGPAPRASRPLALRVTRWTTRRVPTNWRCPCMSR